MVRIKICGITRLEDALEAVRLGADAVGFVFANSPRRITSEIAREISISLPPFISRVGVFVNEDIKSITEIYDLCRLNFVQLHGDETVEYVNGLTIPAIKAFRVEDADILHKIEAYDLNYFLLDSFGHNQRGGTGESFDWEIAREATKFGKLILSGGLNPDNVKEAINIVRPYAVDVSSGVEINPGLKDYDKMKKFITGAKNAAQ